MANELFRSLPGGNDGAVSGADAAYALALCTSGTARARVDAACECAAPNPTLLRSRALDVLTLCARVRAHVAPLLHNLHARLPPPEGAAAVPSAAELEAAVDALYAGKSGTALPAEEFRAWAAVNSAVSGLFAPLALAGTVEG